MRKLIIVALAIIAGCAQTPDMYRSVDNLSPEMRERHFASCRSGSTGYTMSGGLIGVTAGRQYIDDCMRAAGFVREK